MALPDDDGAEQAAALERGRLLFAGPIDFVRGVVALDGLPEGDRTEVAFAGRSNVGKSSLLNALTNRKTLARTSRTPGRTREINFFAAGDNLYLVDLPGYGYARVERRQIEKWTQLVKDYLRGRAGLRRVFLLIDSRHGLKPADLVYMELMDVAAVSYQVVLTKTDKPKSGTVARILERTAGEIAKRAAAHPQIACTSSVTGAGIAELRREIAALVEN